MSLKKIFTWSVLITSMNLLAYAAQTPRYTFTLMLDPTGDAKHTGRKIGDSLERGITLQFCEQLKKEIEQEYSHVRVVLTRFPGETVQPLQNANFANRLSVDAYIIILFFQESETKPQLFLYTFSYGDSFVKVGDELALYSYDQAYLVHSDTTRTWKQQIATALQDTTYASLFTYKGSYSLPFKPLIGIKAPALALEMSLKAKDDWHMYINPIKQSLSCLLTS